jgi:hypothetical protein
VAQMRKKVGVSATNRSITLSPGDIGVIIKRSGHIELLAPRGTTELSTFHQALAGAAVGVKMDERFLDQALSTFRLYYAPPTEAGPQ